MKVPFGEFLPDLGSQSNPGSLVATNVIPAVDGYRQLLGLTTFTNALGAYCRGAIAVKGSDGSVYNYAGDATKLYLLTSATWSDASRLAGGAYTTTTSNRWEFAKYGEQVIATNLDDAPQAITLGGTNFAALSGSPPKAKSVAVVRDFVVLGHINDGAAKKTTVAWSGFGDETQWGSNPLTQADQQEISDNLGVIVKVVGGAYGLVFFERGIVRMDYEGPPTIFRFSTIERRIGAVSAGAVADAGGLVYYLADDGVYVCNGQSIENIGSQKVNQYLARDIDGAYLYRITSAVDYKNSVVMWAYPGNGNADGQPNKLLIYHWPTGRFSTGEVAVNALYAYLSPGFTLEGLDDISASLDALPASLDDPSFQGGRLAFAGFDTAHKTGTFSGDALTATIETTEIDEGMAYMSEARPVIDGQATTVTAQHGHRYSLRDAVTYEAAESESSIGIFEFHKEDRYHRLRVSIAGGFESASGVEVLMRKAGYR
jgi:hypothetical protein